MTATMGNLRKETPTKNKYTMGHIVILYTQGIGENIKNICKRYGIQMHLKGNRTIKNILIKCKDKDLWTGKSGAIYWYQCHNLT